MEGVIEAFLKTTFGMLWKYFMAYYSCTHTYCALGVWVSVPCRLVLEHFTKSILEECITAWGMQAYMSM